MINSMTKKIPTGAEVVIIILISLGYFIYSSAKLLFFNNFSQPITYLNKDLIFLIGYEIGIIVFVILFLKWRGKFIKDYGFSFSLDKLTYGFILFVSCYIVYLVLYFLFFDFVINLKEIFARFSFSSPASINLSPGINPFILIIFSLINPVFEEFLLVGYVITSMRKKTGLFYCVAISVILRLLLHIYQGPIILISILPMGVIFAVYFWYKRSLLPLIIAHAIIDILGLSIIMAQGNA
jgi:membrane protease YdiL (CAAX protease family)